MFSEILRFLQVLLLSHYTLTLYVQFSVMSRHVICPALSHPVPFY